MSNSTENVILPIKKIGKILAVGTSLEPFLSCFLTSEVHTKNSGLFRNLNGDTFKYSILKKFTKN